MEKYAITHQGLVRSNNEDRFLVMELGDGALLLAVADGMGGRAGGEVAAQLTVDSLAGFSLHPGDTARQLGGQILNANKKVCLQARCKKNLQGMGCTATVALIQNDQISWGHVGDSRLYLFRKNKLHQLTTDHNIAQLMVELGEMSRNDSASSPFRHILNQCVGQPDCRPDIGRQALEPGDLVMLCTDGLHGSITDTVIAMHLDQKGSLEAKADKLVK
jgi:protein phosphatase